MKLIPFIVGFLVGDAIAERIARKRRQELAADAILKIAKAIVSRTEPSRN